jgi:hypothetical protein
MRFSGHEFCAGHFYLSTISIFVLKKQQVKFKNEAEVFQICKHLVCCDPDDDDYGHL